MREALRTVICPTCGGPPVADDYFDEQKLRMENARLKEEASLKPHPQPHYSPHIACILVCLISHGVAL